MTTTRFCSILQRTARVDFRELVKDLASVFKTRIELRQIGVRDEAKMLGGLGICGRPFCCCSFLGEFQPVSIKMAKEQELSLNPTKISGTCGRLMCCLKYEQNAYEDLLRITPRVGAYVSTSEGKGTVTEVSLLTGLVKVRMDKASDGAPMIFEREAVKVIRIGLSRPQREDIALRKTNRRIEKAGKSVGKGGAIGLHSTAPLGLLFRVNQNRDAGNILLRA